MKSIKLSAFPPEQQPEDAVVIDGFEPWNLESISDIIALRKDAHKYVESAKTLRDKGHAALPPEDRAFWLSYMTAAKAPLPKPDSTIVDVEESTLKAVATAFDQAKPDMVAFKEAAEKAEQSLVSRFNNIGLFANRGPLRLVALPDWVRAAVVVNTKAKVWEILVSGPDVTGNQPNLALWASAFVLKDSTNPWLGSKSRLRITGLPEMRAAHNAMTGLHVITHLKKKD